MAMAAPDDQHPDAPGRPGADPSDDDLPPRIHRLAEFLAEFTAPDPTPRARIDGHDLTRAFTAWAHLHRHGPTAGPGVLYSDLRRLGLTVRRSSGNRYIVEARTVPPAARPAFDQLLAVAESPEFAAQRHPALEVTTMARDLRLQAGDLARQALEAVLPRTFEAIDEALQSPDVNTRLRATELVWQRIIPKVAVREAPPEAIDVKPTETRPSLMEVENLLRARLTDVAGEHPGVEKHLAGEHLGAGKHSEVGATGRDEGD